MYLKTQKRIQSGDMIYITDDVTLPFQLANNGSHNKKENNMWDIGEVQTTSAPNKAQKVDVKVPVTVQNTGIDPEKYGREYLTNQLWAIRSKKDDELTMKFGLLDDPFPNKTEDLIKRIQDGKYILQSENENEYYDHPLDRITWRDPAIKKDREGFQAAYKEWLETEFQPVSDAVAVLSPTEAMPMVQTLRKS